MRKFTIVEVLLELENEIGLRTYIVPSRIAVVAKGGTLEERAAKRGNEIAESYLKKWKSIKDYSVQYFDTYSERWVQL